MAKTDQAQASLFGELRAAVEVEPVKGETKAQRFQRFHEANPHVFYYLRTRALELKGRGVNRYSIAGLFELLRFDVAIKTAGDTFKLANDYKPRYARLLMKRTPELADFFELRQMEGEDPE